MYKLTALGLAAGVLASSAAQATVPSVTTLRDDDSYLIRSVTVPTYGLHIDVARDTVTLRERLLDAVNAVCADRDNSFTSYASQRCRQQSLRDIRRRMSDKLFAFIK